MVSGKEREIWQSLVTAINSLEPDFLVFTGSRCKIVIIFTQFRVQDIPTALIVS